MKKNQSIKLHVIICFLCTVLFWCVLIAGRNINFKSGIGLFVLCAIFFGSMFFSWMVIKRFSEKNKIAYVLYSLILCFSACWLVASFRTPGITFDTWNMYDMSRYVFADFGYMDFIRQFIVNTHYEMAFPPLFPVLMALVNFVFDIGVLAATFICGISSLWIVSLSAVVGKKLGQILSVALCALFFVSGMYCWLVRAGVSQVLNFSILFMIVIVLLYFKLNIKNVLGLAILASLGLMCRFDFLAVVVVSFIFVVVVSFKERKVNDALKFIFSYTLTVLLLSSPWIVYSIKHFGCFFVTDNGRRLINVVDTDPYTYFSKFCPAQTLFDNFSLWFQAFFDRVYESLWALESGLILYSPFFELIIVAFFLGIFIKYVYKKEFGLKKNEKKDLRKWFVVFLFVGLETIYVLTGYGATRYHIPAFYFSCYIVLSSFLIPLSRSLIENQKKIKNKNVLKNVCVATFILFSFLKCNLFFREGYIFSIFKSALTNSTLYTKEMNLTENEVFLKNYLKKDVKTICFSKAASVKSHRFQVLSNLSYVVTPTNISYDNVRDFVNDFDVNYLYLPDDKTLDIFKLKTNVYETEIPFLYKIDP